MRGSVQTSERPFLTSKAARIGVMVKASGVISLRSCPDCK